jgi:Ca-activated chloride channel homolog
MRRIFAVTLPVLLSAASFAAGAPLQEEVLPSARVVYLTVTDKNGAMVPNLTAADFVVKDSGKEREVLQVESATAPIRIAMIVDDNGTGIFRYGVARFIERLQGRAAFALSTVAGQHLKIVDYTANVADLSDAIGRLTARPGTDDGGQLLEGIFETAKDLEKRKAQRSVIVVLTVGGEEHSTLPAHHVLDQLRQSGAALHVFAVASSALASRVAVTKPAALLGENLNLSEVLGDGPRQSGGQRDEIVATAGIVAGLQQLADTLTHQYVIAYALPPKSNGKINISVKQPGVTVRAPMRVPDR